MITDTAGSIAVAGVMGGAETEVSDSTNTHPARIGQLQLPEHPPHEPDARACAARPASRFGKRVDPELTVKALARACELLEQLAGGKTRPVYGDNYPGKPEPKQIELDPVYANRLLGIDLPAAEMVRILEALEFTCRPVGRVPERGRPDAPPGRQHPGGPGRRDRPHLRLRPAAGQRCCRTSCRRRSATCAWKAKRRSATSWSAAGWTR